MNTEHLKQKGSKKVSSFTIPIASKTAQKPWNQLKHIQSFKQHRTPNTNAPPAKIHRKDSTFYGSQQSVHLSKASRRVLRRNPKPPTTRPPPEAQKRRRRRGNDGVPKREHRDNKKGATFWGLLYMKIWAEVQDPRARFPRCVRKILAFNFRSGIPSNKQIPNIYMYIYTYTKNPEKRKLSSLTK